MLAVIICIQLNSFTVYTIKNKQMLQNNVYKERYIV